MSKDIIEGNKLIHEFRHNGEIPFPKKPNDSHAIWYNRNWNLLMPVVEKIEALHDGVFSFFIVQTDCDIALSSKYKENGDDWYAPNFAQKKGNKLLSTWSAVIHFIQWYNSNPKPVNK